MAKRERMRLDLKNPHVQLRPCTGDMIYCMERIAYLEAERTGEDYRIFYKELLEKACQNLRNRIHRQEWTP
jgi:hypothetical protein